MTLFERVLVATAKWLVHAVDSFCCRRYMSMVARASFQAPPMCSQEQVLHVMMRWAVAGVVAVVAGVVGVMMRWAPSRMTAVAVAVAGVMTAVAAVSSQQTALSFLCVVVFVYSTSCAVVESQGRTE